MQSAAAVSNAGNQAFVCIALLLIRPLVGSALCSSTVWFYAGMLDSDGCVSSWMKGKLKGQLGMRIEFIQSNRVFLQEIQAVLPGGSLHELARRSQRGDANFKIGEYTQVCMLASLTCPGAHDCLPVSEQVLPSKRVVR